MVTRTPVTARTAHLDIAEVAQRTGVPASTLRFYERRKLVLPSSRTTGDYRLYARGDVARVRFIKRAQELGFTLADVELLLRVSGGQVVKRSQLNAVGAAGCRVTES